MIKASIHKAFRVFGLDLVRFPPREQVSSPDIGKDELKVIREVQPWTLTSVGRIYALIQAVRYVSARGLVHLYPRLHDAGYLPSTTTDIGKGRDRPVTDILRKIEYLFF